MTTLRQDKTQFYFGCTKANVTGILEPDMTTRLLHEKEIDTYYIIQGPSRKQSRLKRDELKRVLQGLFREVWAR